MNQSTNNHSLPYPRLKFRRTIMRILGRGLVRLLTRTEIEGLENIPTEGPVILAGNHASYLEPVLMAVYPKRLVELIGAGDLPFRGAVDDIVAFYGFIPVNRGNLDRKGLHQALDVLDQNGVIGIFPEGGTWAPGNMPPQIGVALLSQRTGAPVVPIGFSGLEGSFSRALKLKRPSLVMRIGEPIPAMPAAEKDLDKSGLLNYSQHVLNEIYSLVAEEDKNLVPVESRYSLWIESSGGDRSELSSGAALAKFLHTQTLLNSLKNNLKLPVEALYGLSEKVSATTMQTALQAILDYLKVNPAFFTYRLGKDVGNQVAEEIRGLRALMERLNREGKSIRLHTQAVSTFVCGRQEISQKHFLIEPGV